MSLSNERLIKEIFPGWFLVDGDSGPFRVWGLSQGNHPSFIFPFSSVDLIKDPFDDLTDDEVNAVPEDSPLMAQWHRHSKVIEEMDERMLTMPEIGYSIINAAKQAGYVPEVHGTRFACWLLAQVIACYEL